MTRLATLILLCAVGAANCEAGAVRQESILPTATDPAITLALSPHRAAYGVDVVHRGELFVYLHGAGGTASGASDLIQTAAELGFHAIGITYYMNVQPSQACMTPNFSCHEAFRREIIEGFDYSPQIVISRADSIENRIIKLLQHLEMQHPGEGWTQYLNSDAIRWDSTVVYGHSMGGANTALLAKLHVLKGACVVSPPTDINGWFANPQTPAARMFGFSHINDNFNAIQTAWVTMGLDQFGVLRDVASTMWPYEGTHRLSTSLTPAGAGTDFHNSTTSDAATPRQTDGTPVYKPVWTYMMLGGPACPGDTNADQVVNSADLSVVLGLFNTPVSPFSGGDFNGDGRIDVADLSVLLGQFGQTC